LLQAEQKRKACEIALYSPHLSATQLSFAFVLPTFSQRFHQPFNGFTDFASFGVQFLRVAFVIGLAADEAIKRCRCLLGFLSGELLLTP